MYEIVDRPVASLDRGGRLLVWAMRSWVTAMAERQCPGGRVAGAFGAAGILQGLHPFLRMMALFNRHGLASFEFCSLRCGHVSEHEAIILRLVATGCPGPRSATMKTLALLVEEDCIADLALTVTQLAKAMEHSPILASGN